MAKQKKLEKARATTGKTSGKKKVKKGKKKAKKKAAPKPRANKSTAIMETPIWAKETRYPAKFLR